MAQTISLLGAVYSDVPAVLLPKQGGGTAQFDDTTDANATASDILTGKTAYVNGVKLTGTGSGGGGGSVTQDENGFIILPPTGGGGGGVTGLVYETGTWTPSSDTARGTIEFTNQHSTAPFFYNIIDVSEASTITASSNLQNTFVDYYQLYGAGFPYDTSGSYYRYAEAKSIFSTGSAISYANNMCSRMSDQTGTTEIYPCYWATSTEFYPYSGSTSRYWRANRTYKWIAVWTPST